jgi:hypothetical protein
MPAKPRRLLVEESPKPAQSNIATRWEVIKRPSRAIGLTRLSDMLNADFTLLTKVAMATPRSSDPTSEDKSAWLAQASDPASDDPPSYKTTISLEHTRQAVVLQPVQVLARGAYPKRQEAVLRLCGGSMPPWKSLPVLARCANPKRQEAVLRLCGGSMRPRKPVQVLARCANPKRQEAVLRLCGGSMPPCKSLQAEDKRPCYDFTEGTCDRGSQCKYSHDAPCPGQHEYSPDSRQSGRTSQLSDPASDDKFIQWQNDDIARSQPLFIQNALTLVNKLTFRQKVVT